MLTFYVSHVVPVKEVQGKYSIRRCEWVKGEKIRAKMKRENLERLVFMQGDVVVTHAGVVDGKGGKTRTKEVDNGENLEQWVTTTATKLRHRWWVGIGEGGGRRRWWLRSKNWEHGLRPVIVFVRKWQEKMTREVFDRNICEKDRICRDVFYFIAFNYEENVLKHQYINVFLNWSRMDTFHIYEIQSPSLKYKQNI